ncbi:MAG: hypothetical protein OXC27_09385 [Caldilineaceae bacterium]|nr:hypothetical protein [Caldilineaceae bacterium]
MPVFDIPLLALKMLVALSPSIAALVFWKIKTKPAWACAFAALGVFSIYNLLDPHFSLLLQKYTSLEFNFFPAVGFPELSRIILGLSYGAAREGIKWLVMSLPFTKINRWQDAVFFGLTYAGIIALENLRWQTLGALVRGHISLEVVTSNNPSQPLLEILFNPGRETLAATVEEILTQFSWWPQVGIWVLNWHASDMIMNVGTSLAVFYSVKARKVWPAAAAALCMSTAYLVKFSTQMLVTRDFLIAVYSNFPPLQWLDTFSVGNTTYVLMIITIQILKDMLAVLPALLLGLYVYYVYKKRASNAL